MSEFKIGDRVMVPAVVVEVEDTDVPLCVDFLEMDAAYPLWIDRKDLEKVVIRPTPTGKTVKVRAAVCVADDGRWAVAGATDWSDATSRAHARFFGPSDLTNFIEADVPLPDPQTIPGKVVPSDE